LSVKKIQKMASERSPLKRANCVRRLGRYPVSYLVSVDEVSKDNRTYARMFGRSRVGRRAEMYQPFVRKIRYSMCAAMSVEDGIFSAKVVEGSFNRVKFIAYLRDNLVCYL
ncbi:hypothetical protein BDZ89DRAFT_892139, partial [Hymenopellis radicata]